MSGQIAVRDIRAFRPALVLEVAHRLEVQRRRVVGATDAALRARSVRRSWTGPAADSAAEAQARALAVLGDLAARIGVSASVLHRLAERMEACLGLVRRADRLAEHRGAWTDADGLVQVPHRFSTGDATLDAHVARLDALMVDEVGRCLREAMRVAGETDADVRRRLRAAAGEPMVLAVGDELGLVPPPPDGGVGRPDGAFANAAWWRGLTVSERRSAISEHPEWVGPRDGIPAWDRHQANLILLSRLRGQVSEDLRNAGAIPQRTDVPAWERATSIAAIDALLAKRDGVTRHLLLIDISGPVVRAITTVGDIDRAGHVATYVAGLSTRPGKDLRTYDERFVRLRRLALTQTREKGETGDVAIAVWLGYPAPQGRDGGFSSRSVLRADVARDWADDLASFTNGIDASRDMPVHQTLMAHSYGSVLAAFALRHVMRVDDVAFFGSPGTSLDSLAAAGLKPGALNVLAAPTDPVAMTDWHGLDPRDIPGATTLGATPALKPGTTDQMLTESILHSAYLDEGTTAEFNLAAIVAARPDLRVWPSDWPMVTMPEPPT
ncbi:alpha/beta hydrolase [Intrasporangium sp. DVR]|uniref:alpha/beta hydrolase n=1 Tax=Intrasporangium sp. DVR TaxID=3127867 RepID=UPI00313A7382